MTQDKMTPDQITALWRAAQEAHLSDEQLRSLSAVNPWTQRGEIARRVQLAMAKTSPEVAAAFIADAGAQPSLAALAAEAGLTEMTPDIRAELEALRPKTPEEAKREQIEELIAANPFGKPGYYKDDGSYVAPVPGDLTKIMLLESLAPEKAEAMRLAATPVQPSSAATEAQKRATESQARAESRNHGQRLIQGGF